MADQVVAALQAAHNLEATASEKWHKQEHLFKNSSHRYPKLGKFFDRRHKEAYQRQHDIRKHMMRMGETVETELGDTSYTDDAGMALSDACVRLGDLANAYEVIRDAAKEAGDTWTREKFHGYIQDLNRICHKTEQRLQQANDLGTQTFLSLMT
jgi:ferritin-like metal-binding protein YciE